MKEYSISFDPENISIKASTNSKITDIARKTGLNISVPCGGNSICKKCLIRLKSGLVDSIPEIKPDIYLACNTKPLSDCTFEIINKDNLEFYDQQNNYQEYIKDLIFEKSIFKKHYSINDLEDLRKKFDLTTFENELKDYSTDFTLVYTPNSQIICVEKGNTEKNNFGLAVDLGTTTVDILLVDLNDGSVLANHSIYNLQRQFGEDIITRIIHTEKNDSLKALQNAAVESLNKIIGLFEQSLKIDHNNIYKVFISGNTTMTYLFAGINPFIIRRQEELEEYKSARTANTEDTGLLINRKAEIKLMPGVSAFVGGDITSGILSSRLNKSEKLTLMVDIGTNGEIVLGNSDWMIACSCSAGPAFEGTNISCGCRAIPGAINKISINKNNLTTDFSTINNLKPIGVCGSAVIDLVSEMFENGIIDRQGRLKNKTDNTNFRKNGNVLEYIIASKDDYKIERDITINENDLKNIIRAKAAVFSGINLLLKSVDFDFSDIDEVIIAGAFGQFINFENAIKIGLLPEIDKNKYSFKGNTSLKGSLNVLLCPQKLDNASHISNNVTYIDLSQNPDFMNFYTASLFLPHTDLTLFPLSAKINLEQ